MTPQRPKWLFMVYMQASDTSQLDNIGVQDLIEMEEGVRGNPNVEVIVQIHRRWPAVPQRYLISNAVPGRLDDTTSPARKRSLVDYVNEPKREGELTNMGSSEALADFLKEAWKHSTEKSGGVAPDHSCLVLWGHAFGLGFGRDHHDGLILSELGEALNDFRQQDDFKQKDDPGKKLDVLATNACTMGYIEAAYELKEHVHYLVASQVSVPLTGLPYKSILSGIGDTTKPCELGKRIVDRYVDAFTSSPRAERVAMALLDLERVEPFKELLGEVADAITTVIDEGQENSFERLSEIRDAFLANPAGDVRPVLDLRSLAEDLTELCKSWAPGESTTGVGTAGAVIPATVGDEAIKSLQEAAADLSRAIPDPADPDHARSVGVLAPCSADRDQLMLYHRAHPDLEGMSGVGVFAPFVVDKAFRKDLEIDSDKGRSDYRGLKIFSGEPKWIPLVYDRLRLDEPDEIVDASGVVRPAERVQVNQLILAVEAAFNNLDRVLKKVEPQIVADLGTKGTRFGILRRFGLPHLKLAGGLSLLSAKELKKELEEAGLPEVPPYKESDSQTVVMFEKIEKAVQHVEKTTKRVVTNRTFGLGPPSSVGSSFRGPLHLGIDPKEAGEILGIDPKEAGEILGIDPKEAGEILGIDPKEAGEILGRSARGSETGALVTFLSTDTQVASLAVSSLFARVASSLKLLERAAAHLETAAVPFLFKRDFGAMLSDEDYGETVRVRFAQSFGVMNEVSLQSRRTIRRVLAHPVYGLGPGPQGVGQEERDELAAAAGLNRRNLVLL